MLSFELTSAAIATESTSLHELAPSQRAYDSVQIPFALPACYVVPMHELLLVTGEG